MNQVLRRGDERRRLALGHFRGGLTKLIWEQTYRKFANHWERKLSDDLDVETSAPPGFGNAWIQGALTAIASCKVIARTNEGNIRLSFPADPRTGLDVIGRAAKGRVIIGINDAPPPPSTSPPQTELRSRTQGYDAAPVHIEVSAGSENSNVTIVR